MAYTPPIGNSVELNFSGGAYVAPVGDDVQIQFGNVLDNYIRTNSVYFESQFETLQITEAVLIDTHAFTLEAQYDTLQLNPLVHINTNDSVYELDLDLLQLQILPDIVSHNVQLEYELEMQFIGGNTETDLPSRLSPGLSCSWKVPTESDIHKIFIWNDVETVDKHQTIAITKRGQHTDIHHKIVWDSMFVLDHHSGIDWDVFFLVDIHTLYRWNGMNVIDEFVSYKFDTGTPTDRMSWYRYEQPDPMDRLNTFRHSSQANAADTGKTILFGSGDDLDSDEFHGVPWGPKELYSYCFKNYEPPAPGQSLDFHFPGKYPLYLGANNLIFELDSYSTSPLCSIKHNHTGIRDNYIIPGEVVDPVIPPIPFPIKPVYYIMNTVLVKTLPGNVPIEVKGLSMTIDRDSWLWQLNMTVGKKEYVDLVSPKNGVFPTVEIYINGWKWVFLIEGWTENLGFARGTYTITGRSPSMVLGDPICDKKTLTKTTLATGSYIMQSILESNASAAGFSLAFSGYSNTQTGFDPGTAHWNIPANTFSYSDQTDIQAMQLLSNSIGAYIQTNPAFYNYPAGVDGRILEVLPKYAWQPWQWSLSNTELDFKILDKSIIREIGSTYKKNPDYYGAYIVGEAPKDGAATGVFCDVYKQDKGPACKHAPVESSVLYTTDHIAQERGRMIIADAGIWRDHSIKVFSLFPEPQLPGLFKVGDLINVRNGATSEWIGLITSTTIEASVINTSAFSVSQNLGVSQYVGEWNG